MYKSPPVREYEPAVPPITRHDETVYLIRSLKTHEPMQACMSLTATLQAQKKIKVPTYVTEIPVH